jgi:hypothetical protein
MRRQLALVRKLLNGKITASESEIEMRKITDAFDALQTVRAAALQAELCTDNRRASPGRTSTRAAHLFEPEITRRFEPVAPP